MPRVCCLLLGLCFLSACGRAAPASLPPTAAPVMAPSVTATRPAPTQTLPLAPTPTPPLPVAVTLSATPTPSATETLIPTPTPPALRAPAEGLKTGGPYLIYPQKAFSPYLRMSFDPVEPMTFSVLDADGSGRATFTLPNQGYVVSLRRAFSPDGRWIAYFTGSPEFPGPDDTRYHFALRLYNWRTGEDRLVTELISPDYPANYQKTISMLMNDNANLWGQLDLEHSLPEIFNGGVSRPAWSPDGRYLAFAGEMDGPSSDLYLYVLSTGEIRRLTDGPAYIDSLTWAPDSRTIFHTSAYHMCEGDCDYYHVAQIDGKTWDLGNIDSHGGVNLFAGWVSDHQRAVFSHANGPAGPLRYLDIVTGQDQIIFDRPTYDAVYDPLSRQWLVTSKDAGLSLAESGLYLVNPLTRAFRQISPINCYQVDLWGYQDLTFAAACGEELGDLRLTFIRADGTLVEPVDGPVTSWGAAQSPDKQWFLTSSTEGAGWLRLYTGAGNLRRELPGIAGTSLIWRPDSAGFYFLAPDWVKNLFYYELADGQLIQLDETIQLDPDKRWEYVWTR